MEEYRILTGTAKEVENEINRLAKKYWLSFHALSATDHTTTVIVYISKRQ